MPATGSSSIAHDNSANDVLWDPQESLTHSSPLMKALRPKLLPSPSPPPAARPLVSQPPNCNNQYSNRHRKAPPTQGDAVLIHHLGGGKRPEIAAEVMSSPLHRWREGRSGYNRGGAEESVSEDSSDDDEVKSNHMSPDPVPRHNDSRSNELFSLQSLAQDVLQISSTPVPGSSRTNGASPEGKTDGIRSVLNPPPSYNPPRSLPQAIPNRNRSTSQVLMPPIDVVSPPARLPMASEPQKSLPPIMLASPRSETGTLPSIRSHLHDQLSPPRHEGLVPPSASFPSSPPTSGLPPMNVPTSHVSPPISPNDTYQVMQSPAHSFMSPFSSSSQYQHSSRDTPTTDISTPATQGSITDRMSIDHMTNASGVFVCKVPGCNAAPFQTQYLLNSHANVHSQSRPHYCPVEGCPRSEGGKGFKRKNEMIRHGLVHDSPGYVCPFCPDREHRYPRPDNLQRHVRVHHVDVEKDDPQLRDVLAQRPDGPNRGRRRRGVP